MAHTRRTLQLTNEWDLTLDGVGRICVTHGDLATAQNVANEARLFTNDAYFIQDQGIPYFTIVLGYRVNASILRSYLRRAALLVPDVREVLSVQVHSLDDAAAKGSLREKVSQMRSLTGVIHFTTVEGTDNGTIQTYF